jgi:hypothetical protein
MSYTSASARNPTQILTREPTPPINEENLRRAGRIAAGWRLVEAAGTSRGHAEKDHTLGRSSGVGARWMDLYSTPHQCRQAGDKDDGADEGEERASPRRR